MERREGAAGGRKAAAGPSRFSSAVSLLLLFRSPPGQKLGTAGTGECRAGAASAWVASGRGAAGLESSRAGEQLGGLQPSCSRAPSAARTPAAAPAAGRRRPHGKPMAVSAPDPPCRPCSQGSPSFFPACLCQPSHLGALPRLTPQTTEGPDSVQFQPKAAPGRSPRQCPLVTGKGLAPERGTGSSRPRWEEREHGGKQLRAKAGAFLHILFSQRGLRLQGQQPGKEHLW